MIKDGMVWYGNVKQSTSGKYLLRYLLTLLREVSYRIHLPYPGKNNRTVRLQPCGGGGASGLYQVG